jgi:hypothetical protein
MAQPMVFVAPIVEGQGEVSAVPILLRRIMEHAKGRRTCVSIRQSE